MRGGLTVFTHKRHLHVFQLTEEELDGLHDAGNYKTLDIALFSACVSAFLATLGTLLSVDALGGKTYVTFLTLCFATGVGSVFFGARAWLAWKEAKGKLAIIKKTDAS